MLSATLVKSIGLVAGPALFALTLVLPLEIAFEAKVVLATTIWMATWWIAEAIPIYATALLPLILVPLFGVLPLSQIAAPYTDRIVFLLLGGFMIAAAIEKSGLHERFALNVIRIFGSKPRSILGGFIATTAMLSAWISNSATTVMMLPIAASILPYVKDEKERARFGTSLMLSVAYAASIGGIATLIGTPPNAIFASLSKSLANVEIGFGQWMLVGVPVSAISLAAMWLYMVKYSKLDKSKPILEGREVVSERLKRMGPMTRREKIVSAVFGATVVAWISRSLLWGPLAPMVDDSMIALAGALALFVFPSGKGERILDWATAVKIPWGVLLLIGGGLALASAFAATGLDKWISERLLVAAPANTLLVVLMLVAFTIFVTEIMSNTATASLLIPIGAGIATTLGMSPLPVMLVVAMAASHSFMLPIATPPNSIVFGSGYVTVRQMVRAGFMLNIFGIIIMTLAAVLLVPILWP
jgi:sodium-dependent dicarboxylate transporter 2/3/5